MSVRLLRVELRRFWARRAIVGGLLAALLLALVVNVVQLARSKADISYVRVSVAEADVTGCSVGQHDGLPVVGRACGSGFDVQAEPTTVVPGSGTGGQVQMVAAYVTTGHDRRIDVARTYADTVRGVGIALTLLVAFLSATFVAADFGTSIGTQLLFEPRRRRVYVNKTLAVAIGCGTVAAAVLLWCGLLQYAGSSLRGINTGIDGTWIRHRAGDLGLAIAASAMMAVIAFAIGVVTRRTAAAVGALFGLLIALQFLRHTLRSVGRITPVNAIWALASGLTQRNDAFLGLHTLAGAAAIALVWVVGVTVVGAAWFARREIR